MNKKHLNIIYKKFEVLKGEIEISKITIGLINESYRIDNKTTGKTFFLQKMNVSIFENMDQLMMNLFLISNHIRKKLWENKDFKYQQANFYQTLKEKQLFRSKNGDLWRLSDFIFNNTTSKESNDSDSEWKKKLAFSSGEILGKFHFLCSDLDPDLIGETIPDFHNISTRKDQLQVLMSRKNTRFLSTVDIAGRINSYDYLIGEYEVIISNGYLMKRIVHNDPKLDNVLFDDNQNAISLIDLDTVMPGFLPIDFGDAIRSLCNTSNENERDLEKVDFSLEMFKSYTDGYLKEVSKFITLHERNYLSIFPLLLCLEQAIRFYNDYLADDVYYKTSYPDQNLDRTLVQLKLLDQMTASYKEMSNYIDNWK